MKMFKRLNKKNIYLLDGAGALTSAITTGIILPQFSNWTAIPNEIAFSLAAVALLFATYSLTCYARGITKPAMLLAIILANAIYCLVSLAILISLNDVTIWGQAYLAGEVAIILVVVVLEISVFSQVQRP